MLRKRNGGIAQLGEHLPYKQRVTGSIPVVPTMTEGAEDRKDLCTALDI